MKTEDLKIGDLVMYRALPSFIKKVKGNKVLIQTKFGNTIVENNELSSMKCKITSA